jgi:hypothetical protein
MIDDPDPESSYRRGYYQGAHDAYQATKTMTTDKIDHWLNVSLHDWRYKDRVTNRRLSPPRPWVRER